jgi:anti-anti-sigma factor
MAADFEFSCETNGTLLIVRGDCDLIGAKRLAERIAAFDDQPVEIDMQGVTFFDSSALSVLLAARERNALLRVGDVSQEVAIVLKITGTYRLLREAPADQPSLSTQGRS